MRTLFDICFILVLGLSGFVYRKNPQARLNRYFSLAALALFAWLFTLYLYDGGGAGAAFTLTMLGRLNYSAVLYVALLGYLFVAELIGRPLEKSTLRLMLAETIILTVATLATPFIDMAATVAGAGSLPRTEFGSLISIYVLHIAAYLSEGVLLAISAMRNAPHRLSRQIATVVLGMLTSAALGLFVDIYLPFVAGDFRFENPGARLPSFTSLR